MNSSTTKTKDGSIDTFPDEILLAILSKMQFKEAARTSVLSRRWKNIWKFCTCLDFDGTENMKHLCSRSIEPARGRFINWVNHVLEYSYMELCTVEELKITYDLGEDHANEIDEWICFAIAKRVKSLKLHFAPIPNYDSRSSYTFQDSLLELPRNTSGFDSLTTLSLKGVDVTGDMVTIILSNCPLLETLALQNARSLLSLVVNGTSLLKLKYLKIVDCFQLKALEISAKNLVSFKYFGTQVDLSFENVPLLSEFHIGGSYVKYWIHQLDQLSYSLSQLHTLNLNLCFVNCAAFYSFPANYPEFMNLKHLELRFLEFNDVHLAFMVFLLETTPYLRSLMVKVQESRPCVEENDSYCLIPSKSDCLIKNLWSNQRVETYEHNYLKVVELVGWNGEEANIMLANYLLEMAVSLDKLTIDPCFYYKKRQIFREKSPTEARKEVVRKRAKQLESKLPLGAKLLIR